MKRWWGMKVTAMTLCKQEARGRGGKQRWKRSWIALGSATFLQDKTWSCKDCRQRESAKATDLPRAGVIILEAAVTLE